MPVKFLDLQSQYRRIKPEIDHAIQAVIDDTAFAGGPYVERFEREFAEYQGIDHCVGVGNGTDALEIALEALELPPESEILVPANSFIATAEAVSRAGHRVVFCDVHPHSYCLDVADARRRLTPATAAVIPVHLYGQPADMPAICQFAKDAGLRVLEDCAQAHGAQIGGQPVGTFGDAGTFSFYPGKNLGAYGDAGAIVTNDGNLARRCRLIANHGRSSKFDHEIEGRNSRLDGVQAAVLSAKLAFLDDWIARRQQAAQLYMQELAGVGDLVLPQPQGNVRHVWHLFVVRTGHVEQLADFLAERQIQTGRHYPLALPKLGAYSHVGQQAESGFAWKADRELLSLPMGEHLDEQMVLEVIAALGEYFDQSGDGGVL